MAENLLIFEQTVKEAIRNMNVYRDQEQLCETVERMKENRETGVLQEILREVLESVDTNIGGLAYEHLEYLLFVFQQVFRLCAANVLLM